MLLKYKEISKKIFNMFLQETVSEEKILDFAYVQKMRVFFSFWYFNILFSLNFYFIQKCTEMIPEKGHKNRNWKYCLLEFKNGFVFPCRNKLLYTI